MSQNKLFDDVTTRRVLNKLIPTDSPHYMKMHALVVHVISLVSDDKVDLVFSTPYDNLKGFTGIDCEDVIKQIIRQGKTVEWAVSYMLIAFYQTPTFTKPPDKYYD